MGCKQSKEKVTTAVKANVDTVTFAAETPKAKQPSAVEDTAPRIKRPATPTRHQSISVVVEMDTDDLKRNHGAARPAPNGTRFSNGAPTIEGTNKAMFAEGLLYQIPYNDGNSWSFYNDTNSSEMLVTFVFGPRSEIEVGGKN